MPLLTLSQVTKEYADQVVIEGVSIKLEPGQKAGLIGPNGSGKTTILKIISGELKPDRGEVHLAKEISLGYLSQEPPELKEGTLRRHLEHPLRQVFDLKKELSALEERIACRAEEQGYAEDQDLKRYSELTAAFEEQQGYQVEKKLLGIAKGLGFKEEDLNRDLSTFSGGEKTRARLAGLLLKELDLLLLDEPTNFLDLEALEWLEKYLRELKAALLVVSHDRFFLDRVAGSIFALQGSKLKAYSGNYSAYQQQLASETLSAGREQQRLERIKAREERLVREAKGDERSKRQARSRKKRLEKLEPATSLPPQAEHFKLGLGYSGRSGRQVIIFDQVSMEFAGRKLFTDLSFEINWGDRVALLGPNGAGKSTLLKMIAGDITPTAGTIRLGPSVKVTYFAQEQQQLDPDQTLLETITAASGYNTGEARNHLGRYLFKNDTVFKKVRDLSGGEKTRLALARLALKSGNCLLMDEPTSHLDLPALEEIETVLANYPGTLIIVSHDRYFLKGLANRVFTLQNGSLKLHNYSFDQYLFEKEKAAVSNPPGLKKDDHKELEKKKRQEEHRRRQKAQKKRRRLKDEQARLEEAISAQEEAIKTIEETLASPEHYGDHHELAALGRRLETAKQELSLLFKSWEEVSAQLEEA